MYACMYVNVYVCVCAPQPRTGTRASTMQKSKWGRENVEGTRERGGKGGGVEGRGGDLVTAVDGVLAVDLCEPFVVTVLLRCALSTAGASATSPEPSSWLCGAGGSEEERRRRRGGDTVVCVSVQRGVFMAHGVCVCVSRCRADAHGLVKSRVRRHLHLRCYTCVVH